jgi:hypothetical protein
MVQESRSLAAGARRFLAGATFLVVVVVSGAACNKADEGLTQKLLESNDKVLACEKELAETKREVKGLKRQLAEAMANPTHIQLKDPELIELVASIRGTTPAAVANGDLQPTLDTKKASAVVMEGSKAMQMCYERALKKNAALQMQAGIRFKLGVTVKPTGSVEEVSVDPSVDKGLTDCIRTTALHWKFPSFQGQAVTIEQPFTLTPKT